MSAADRVLPMYIWISRPWSAKESRISWDIFPPRGSKSIGQPENLRNVSSWMKSNFSARNVPEDL